MQDSGMKPNVLTRLLHGNPDRARRVPSKNPRIALYISVLIGLVSGTLYGFGRYAKDLKYMLGENQLQVQMFGILLDCGNYIGHPAVGLYYDRMGSRASCMAAALVVFSAYMSVHLGVTNYTSVFRALSVMGSSFFLVGFGGGLGYIAALGSTTKTYEKTPYLRRAVGIVAAGYGLSSSVVGISYGIVGITHFFLLWAIIVAVVNIVGAFLLNDVSQEQELTLDDSFDDDTFDSDPEVSHPPGPWESWRKMDFWLLFASFMCCTGCGLFVINNVSTMVQSSGGSDALATSLVILLSICNCSGRILVGLLKQSRSLSLFHSVSVIMTVSMFFGAAFCGPGKLYALVLTVVLTAIAYGGNWVLIVCILSDWFGNRDFGKNYGLMAMAPALSGIMFNTVSAKLYEEHVSPGSDICVGTMCYRGAFIYAGTTAAVGVLLLSYLVVCRERYHRPDYARTDSAGIEEVCLSRTEEP